MNLIPISANQQTSKSKYQHINMSPEAIALANVQTQKVKTVSPEHEIYLTGKVAVNEQRLAVITANYSGRIEKLFIDFTGQTVSKGQRLATIYSPELVTAQKELMEAGRFKDVNPALYNAAKEKLRLWKINEAQISKIETSGVVLTEIDVYADRSGIVIRRDVAKGDYVNKGSVLFEIADLSKVWVFLDAYESDLPFMKTGQKITFTVSSIPGKEFTSSVSFIDPFINPQTRTASVRAEINNPQLLLKPEMFVKGKIQATLSTHQLNSKSIIIPNTSLLWTGKRSVVYVKVPDTEFPAFEMREIMLGASLGEHYIVESGLTEGEEIVTNGVFSIDAAAQLSGNYSMMNRPTQQLPVPEAFQSQVTTLINRYFSVKNALTESDYAQAKKAGKSMLEALKAIDMTPLSDPARNLWTEKEKDIQRYTEKLIQATTIEKQRASFSVISDILIDVMGELEVTTTTLYVDYCPMVFDDQGARWLSEFEKIRNPYFGESMLRCGEVKREIAPAENDKTNAGTPHEQQHRH